MTILRGAQLLSFPACERFAKNTSLLVSVGCSNAHVDLTENSS